jgi:hypothetical protein
MMNQGPIPERLLDLLAEEATQGLSPAQQAELDALLAQHPGADAEGLLLAAAAMDLAAAPADSEPMPAALRASLESAGLAAVSASSQRGPADEGRTLKFPDARRSGFPAWGGWLAAAACLALAAAGWWTAMQGGPGAGPGGAAQATLAQFEQLAAEPGSVRLAWADWALGGQPPTIAGVRGEVVWNEARQSGYLLFDGLPKNDPTKEQYQLWIVDSRDLFDKNGQSARISGAIFDAVEGKFVIPITPAIPVQGAGLFAITIEEPGGTWVSDMSRRVVVAAKPAG